MGKFTPGGVADYRLGVALVLGEGLGKGGG